MVEIWDSKFESYTYKEGENVEEVERKLILGESR